MRKRSNIFGSMMAELPYGKFFFNFVVTCAIPCLLLSDCFFARFYNCKLN